MNTKIGKDTTKAAEIINAGGLVVFPTETVYGIGADALNLDAITKIYNAKNRPSDNPLIIHVDSLESAQKFGEFNEQALKLAENFWPGPMTLVVPIKQSLKIPAAGDLNTVAIRIPNNKYALELIRKSKTAIAAPSANISGKPSSTKPMHIIESSLFESIDYLIDSEPAEIGLESTIIDLSAPNELPQILREGGLTIEDISEIIEVANNQDLIETANIFKPKAPGMKYRHYSPETELKVINQNSDLEKYVDSETLIVASEEFIDSILKKYPHKLFEFISLGSSSNLKSIAKNLYDALIQIDSYQQIEISLIQKFSETGLGGAINNRIEKAVSK